MYQTMGGAVDITVMGIPHGAIWFVIRYMLTKFLHYVYSYNCETKCWKTVYIGRS